MEKLIRCDRFHAKIDEVNFWYRNVFSARFAAFDRPLATHDAHRDSTGIVLQGAIRRRCAADFGWRFGDGLDLSELLVALPSFFAFLPPPWLLWRSLAFTHVLRAWPWLLVLDSTLLLLLTLGRTLLLALNLLLMLGGILLLSLKLLLLMLRRPLLLSLRERRLSLLWRAFGRGRPVHHFALWQLAGSCRSTLLAQLWRRSMLLILRPGYPFMERLSPLNSLGCRLHRLLRCYRAGARPVMIILALQRLLLLYPRIAVP